MRSNRSSQGAGAGAGAGVGAGAAETFNCNVKLLQMRGYYLHPQDDWHSRSVAKASSNNGRVVALKYLKKAQNNCELQILQYLQHQPDLHYVIPLIDSIAVTHGDIIVMPSLWPLEVMINKDPSIAQPMRTQFLEAVLFLHRNKVAHLDLKPGNALVDIIPFPRLSLIDFGLSVIGADEDTEVVGYRGTPSWSAPEVGTMDGPRLKFKAILADRWSCGKVLWFIKQGAPFMVSDPEFDHQCERLLGSDPETRPSLETVFQSQSSSSRAKAMTKRSPDLESQFVLKRARTKWCVHLSLPCI